MRYLLVLLVSVNLYSQDYITTLSGKTTEGKYIDLSETHLQFQQKGSDVVSKIPVTSVVRVTLANGNVIYEQSGLLK